MDIWNLNDHFRDIMSRARKGVQEPMFDYHWFFVTRVKEAAKKDELEHKEEWIANGHGEYSTLTSIKEFYDAKKKSKNFVIHFYHTSNMRCEIVHKHLAILATQHIETKFCKLDVKLAQSFCDNLYLHDNPGIIVYKESKCVDYIIGFDDLGGVDDFSTEMLEWRLARCDIIHYFGDFLFSPDSNVGKIQRSFIVWLEETMRNIMDDSDDTTEDRGRDNITEDRGRVKSW